jgi:Acetoacetate decarboxylase (ADC)
MPRAGHMEVSRFVTGATVREINGYKTEAWNLKGAQTLNIYYEIDNHTIEDLIPVAARPSIPAYGIFNVVHYPESPVGPFTIAEVRIGCRAGVRPRGFTLRSYVSTEAAANELASRWGYPAVPGDVYLRAFHDRVVGRVKTGGKTILEMEMIDRDFIAGNDIQYVSNMHLARNKEDGKLVIIQVDPEWTFIKAERGRPHIISLDSQAWDAGDVLRADYPISASYTVTDVTLSPIRYILDPNQDAFKGTTKLAA